MSVLAAVVFDFDGLLVDTETPTYEEIAGVLTAMGHDLSVPDWARVIGLGHGDGLDALDVVLGTPLDRTDYQRRTALLDRAWKHTVPAVDGAATLLDELRRVDVPLAVASSSPAAWVEGHLDRLGLLDRFAAIATIDRVGGRAKPAPDTYLAACATLGVEPARSVAVEDSAPGLAAARAAGLRTVAVPSAITRHTDLSAADLTVASLVDLGAEDLAALVE